MATKKQTRTPPKRKKTSVAARKPRAAKRTTLPALVKLGREILGIEELRPGQGEALRHILAGRDVLAVMPTGSGKSLLYQLTSLVLPGLTVVVSPLIALITDQVEKMREKGVAVARIDSTLTVKQKREMMGLAMAPGGKLLLTTPERMADPEFRKLLRQASGAVGVSLFVVDEAHCVSQWGHDFRPAYLVLRQAVEELGRPQVLATTATAPPHVREDILYQLGIPKAKVVTTSFDRPNLSFEVIPVPGEDDKKKVLLALVKKLKRPGIVYCATVKAVEQLSEELGRHGIPVSSYHGRMVKSVRDAEQARFMEKRSKLVMVATNAFGLGVDKPDIRYVLHYHVPGSLEQYAQEAGRGGRDGQPARCVLLFSPDDVAIQEYFLKGTYPARRQVLGVVDALEAWGKENRPATLNELAMSSHVGMARTRTVLALLKDEGWVVEERGHFRLSDPPPGRDEVRDRARDYEKRRIADRRRLDALLEYVRAPGCRNLVILSYLGEKVKATARCGRCDNDLRSAAEARDAAARAEALEAVLAQKSAEAEGEVGGEPEPPPSKRRTTRTRVISLEPPAPAGTQVAAPQPAPEPPPAAESEEVEAIETTAAELAAAPVGDGESEITIRKRKRRAPPERPAPPPRPAHPAEARQVHGKKKRRRRKGHAHVVPRVQPPAPFTSPVLVIAPGQKPPPAETRAAAPAETPTAPPAPGVAAAPPPSVASARNAGPIVEYVRRPMKIASMPVASATPTDQPSRRHRKRYKSAGGPSVPARPGAAPWAAGGNTGAPARPGPPPAPGAHAPGQPSPPGEGKRRRRRRRRRRGLEGTAMVPGAAPGGVAPVSSPGTAPGVPVGAGPAGPTAGGAPPPTGTASAPVAAGRQISPVSFWAPSGGQPGGQPGSGKKRRRRRRRRRHGGGGVNGVAPVPTGGAPPGANASSAAGSEASSKPPAAPSAPPSGAPGGRKDEPP